MDFRPRFHYPIAIALLVVFLISTGSTPARAAGIGGYVGPFQSWATAIESVFAQAIAFVEPHHTVAVEISPATMWHASGKAASAAALNSIVATSQSTASPTIVHVDIASSASVLAGPRAATKAPRSAVSPLSAGIVLGTSTTDGVVTQSEMQAAIEQASNSLRQLIYANAGTVGQGQYSTGGSNNIALSNKIDQLNGTTLTNVVVHGVQGLAAADIPDLSAKYVTINSAGTALSGIFSSNVGIGTTSPTALLTLDSTSTTGTILRIGNGSSGGNVYDLLDTGSSNTGGAGRLDFFDKTVGAARLSIAADGNVGIGTTSPFTTFAVNGNGYLAGNLNVGDASTTRNNLGLVYANNVNAVYPTYNIVTWGDSLTAGNEDGTGVTFPGVLSTTLGNRLVYNGGVGGQTSTQIEARMVADTTKSSWTVVIWAGRNNFSNPSQVEADVAAMIASLGSNSHYLVLSVENGSGETSGDLPRDFRTGHYLRDCPPNWRSGCASQGLRTSRWWQSCEKRIESR
jgi:hypothetical protein